MLLITTHYQSLSALRNRPRFIAAFIFLALPALAFAQDRVQDRNCLRGSRQSERLR